MSEPFDPVVEEALAGQVLDPHDRWVDPQRTARVNVGVNDEERREREADDLLSDFGSGALNESRRRRLEED